MPITPDMLIGRRYKLLECLGAGGMGEVWKAQDTNFTRTVVVAVKLLKEDETIADDTRHRSNFVRVMQREAAAGHLTFDLIIEALDETFNVGVNRDALRAMAASRFADGRVSLEQAVAFFDELVNDTIYNENARHRRRLRDLFAAEANSVAVLQHPNIVRVTDYGEQSGLPYLVMDFISGRTLQQVIQRKEPMKLTDRLRLMEDLCEGLSYAHAKDLVHRDIKPANLIIDSDTKRLKILDFGVARTLQLNAQRSVSMGAPIGTYCYMSPEQTRAARTLDNRSDIFSVGLVFYELLSFKRAFPSTGDIGELIGRIQRDGPPPLAELVPNLDPEIDTIIHKAIEKVPAKRYQDLAEMRRDIELVRARIENEEKARSGKTADATIFARPKPVRQQVTDLVDRATSAFDTGDDHAVIEFSDQILSLMPDQPDALELKARAHARIRQHLMEAAIADAHKLLARGEITAAGEILSRPEIDRTTTAVRQFARDLDAARWNRRIDGLLDQARRLLDAGQLNEAIEAAGAVLELEAHNITAREISEQASQRLAALHQEQVDAAIGQADLAAADDRLEDAIQILSAFAGEHEVDRKLAALEQQRAERLRREAATHDALRHARDLIARDDLVGALDAVTDAQALSPANEEAAKLFAQLTAIVPALTALDEAIARFGQDSIASAEAQLEYAASALNAFVDRFPSVRKRLAAAATAREAAVKREIERKQREAEAAERARRRAEQLERERIAAAVRDATEIARTAIAKSSFDSAEQAIASLARLPESADAVRMVTAELTRARQQAVDKAARQQRDAARQLARRGQLEEALAMLEAFEPAHAAVTAEIQTVRNAITQRDEKLARQREAERLRLEEERARAAEAERARLELERRVDQALTAGDSLFAAGKRAQGIQLLADFTPQHPRVQERLRALRSEHDRLEKEAAAAEERKRAEEALRARQELERRADETIALSDALFAAGDYTQALNRLARFEPPHPRVQDRLNALRTEKERIEEIARKEKQRQEEAARLEKQRQEEAARTEKQRLEDEARKEQQRQEEAARAAAERARAEEAERQRLALEERASEAIASADALFTAGSHADAIKLLDTFEVPHPRVQTRRDQLRKEHKRLQDEARKEQQRQEEAARAAAERARAAEAERQRLELEARANDAIASADALFTAGSHAEAIQLLDAFEPRHSRVQTRRDVLRKEVQRFQEEARKEQQRQEEAARAAEAERLRQEEERERKQREAEEAARAAAERERVEAEIKDLLARATTAEAAGDYRSALELATEVAKLDASNAEAIRLKSNVITSVREAFQKNKTDSALRETLALYDPWFFRRRLAIRAAAVAAVIVLTTTIITRLPWSSNDTDLTSAPPPVAAPPTTEPAPTATPTPIPPEPPPPAPPPDMASLTVDLLPWARVRIVPADSTVTVPADPELTPFTVTLPPGEYILRAENGGLTNAFEVKVQLKPGEQSRVSRELPGFNPDTVIEKLLGQGR